MQQGELWFDDLYDALRHVINVAGGPKKVGSLLWPQMTAHRAGERLYACLNRDRSEKLDFEQLMFLLKLGRESGAHDAVVHINTISGYAPPTPVNPRDEHAELQRQVVRAADEFKRTVARLEQLQQQTLVTPTHLHPVHGGR